MALLTPKDIREHTFQTVRFKEGYDVDEVDDFLDQVTETVEALGKQAVASGQATQSLGPDVAGLNSKISELSAQVQSLQQENATLKAAAAQGAGELATALIAQASSGRTGSQQAQAHGGRVESNPCAVGSERTAEGPGGSPVRAGRPAHRTGGCSCRPGGSGRSAGPPCSMSATHSVHRPKTCTRQLASAQQQVAAAQQQAAEILQLNARLEEAQAQVAQAQQLTQQHAAQSQQAG